MTQVQVLESNEQSRQSWTEQLSSTPIQNDNVFQVLIQTVEYKVHRLENTLKILEPRLDSTLNGSENTLSS